MKINGKDLDILKDELDLQNEEAINLLVRYNGDIKAVLDYWLNDFKFKN